MNIWVLVINSKPCFSPVAFRTCSVIIYKHILNISWPLPTLINEEMLTFIYGLS